MRQWSQVFSRIITVYQLELSLFYHNTVDVKLLHNSIPLLRTLLGYGSALLTADSCGRLELLPSTTRRQVVVTENT